MTGKKKDIFQNPRYGKIIAFMFQYQQDNKYPASIREIAAKAEIPSTSVVIYYLQRLELLGYVIRIPKLSRGAVLTNRGDRLARSILGITLPVCPHCGSLLPGSDGVTGKQIPKDYKVKLKATYVN